MQTLVKGLNVPNRVDTLDMSLFERTTSRPPVVSIASITLPNLYSTQIGISVDGNRSG